MVKSSVQVIVRTRPTSNFAHDCIQVDPEAKVRWDEQSDETDTL